MHRIENKKFGKYTFAPLITYHKIEVVRRSHDLKSCPPNFFGGVKFWPLGGGNEKFFFQFWNKVGYGESRGGTEKAVADKKFSTLIIYFLIQF